MYFSGIAIATRDRIVKKTTTILPDNSYIISNQSSGIIARCVTGLGPPTGDNNGFLGGWYFNGNKIRNRGCTNSDKVIQPSGADIRKIIGIINLQLCKPLTASSEGVYQCRIMNSSSMYETKRLGIYFSGRSE